MVVQSLPEASLESLLEQFSVSNGQLTPSNFSEQVRDRRRVPGAVVSNVASAGHNVSAQLSHSAQSAHVGHQ